MLFTVKLAYSIAIQSNSQKHHKLLGPNLEVTGPPKDPHLLVVCNTRQSHDKQRDRPLRVHSQPFMQVLPRENRRLRPHLPRLHQGYIILGTDAQQCNCKLDELPTLSLQGVDPPEPDFHSPHGRDTKLGKTTSQRACGGYGAGEMRQYLRIKISTPKPK